MHCSFKGGRGVTLLPAPLPAISTKVEKKCALRVRSPPGFSNETFFGGLVFMSFFIFS